MAELGQQWEKVSILVGRMSSDCRDRYRNHIANREARVSGELRMLVLALKVVSCIQSGHWTKNEEEELTRIVTEMTVQQGKDIDNDVFWGKVSERMGNTRGRQQCRIKWSAFTLWGFFYGINSSFGHQDRFVEQNCEKRGPETSVESTGCLHISS